MLDPTVKLALLVLLIPGATLVVHTVLGLMLPRKGDWLATTAVFASLGIASYLFARMLITGAHYNLPFEVPWLNLGNRVIPAGILVDNLTIVMLGVVTLISALVHLYSIGYMEGDVRYCRYYTYLLLFTTSMLGLVLSNNLITLYMCWELVGLSSYLLIGHWFEKRSAYNAAIKAFIVTRIGDVGMFIAILIIFFKTGSLRYVDVFHAVAVGKISGTLLTLVGLGLFFGAMGKSAQVPTHTWLPHAMVAPTPVSAYLHAAAMVKLGVYLMLRVYIEVGFTQIVTIACLVVGLISMMYGCIMYFPQRDLKRLLAYSTITQLSYILTGVGIASLGSSLALQGAALHIFNHGFAKELFFLTAGLISYSTGTRLLNEISGLKKIKGAAVGFIVAAMSITGIPPFNCFWSKISIIIGGYQTGTLVGIIASTIILFESLICFIWFLRILTQCIMGKPSERVEKAQEVPSSMKLVIYSLVLFTLISPIIAGPFLRLLINP